MDHVASTVVRRPSLPVVLASVFGLGLVVRVGTVLAHFKDLPLGLDDNNWYHTQANLLADHGGIFEPFVWRDTGELVASAGHPPGYPMYLSLWSLVGFDTPLAHRLASSVAGALGVVAVALLAHAVVRLVGWAPDRAVRAAAVAGVLAALYPGLWINDGLILAESPYVAVFALSLLAALRLWERPSWSRAVVLGAALGVATLIRTEALTLSVFLVLPLVLVLRDVDWRRRLGLLVAVGATMVVVLAPWVGRNLATFEEPVVIASGTGRVLAYGNCERTYEGQFLGYWHGTCTLSEFPPGDESIVDEAHREKAVAFIEDNLGRTPKVVAARIGRMWGVFRPGQAVDFDILFERRGVAPSRLGATMYYLMLPLAVAGLAVLRRHRVTLVPFLGPVVMITWTAAITFGLTRYRVAVEVILIVLATVAVEALLARYRPVGDGPDGVRGPPRREDREPVPATQSSGATTP